MYSHTEWCQGFYRGSEKSCCKGDNKSDNDRDADGAKGTADGERNRKGACQSDGKSKSQTDCSDEVST